ncbi:MAG: helix-turn-helix domain-containing protein [Candidatus Aminicenantes bacterium]|nr:helix-turn-helix domain-containing protein [Candidatus Aminicenantes bacterium]
MKRSFGNILTIEDLSAYLKIPKSTLYKLAREGRVPSNKIGRHWRFQKRAIDRWLGGASVPVRKEKGGGDSGVRRRGKRI